MTMTMTNPTQLKSKAERGYAEQFEAMAAKLPGGPDALAARRAAMASFVAQGLPHRRVEEWKYTDLRAALKEALPPAQPSAGALDEQVLTAALGPLATIDCSRMVFVDGRFAPELSFAGAIDGASISTLANSGAQSPGEPAGASAAVLALNRAFATDGAVIEVMAGRGLDRPLMLVCVATASDPSTVTTRHDIEIGEDSTACIVEVHVQIGEAAIHGNTLTQMRIGARAVVDHVKVVTGSAAGVHLCNWTVAVDANAIYRPAHLTPGAGLARNDVAVKLIGTGARLDFAGIALGRGSDHIDTTMVIHHVAPGCQSRELFKTILDGNARAVFQGKVIVDKDAQKTDGKQMAKALMLSPNAEFDSKPELEIYADDVACGHGSTCAELDPDLIFYCRSRGIPEAEARALLLESFVGDAIDKIDHPEIRRAASEIATAWLTQKSA
jgi:Fe-S cluster assembly protein SufD